eukprot:TRINITY_DN355_c0_g1_i3.p2 TRINITY_DN355_c0_g1~~TRINITY_DN355_c0_g1_i3.p2  ORF type:complete len:222 (-),score=-15.60 TRINITY_DN355_c0_g1_i3:644-1309(-)
MRIKPSRIKHPSIWSGERYIYGPQTTWIDNIIQKWQTFTLKRDGSGLLGMLITESSGTHQWRHTINIPAYRTRRSTKGLFLTWIPIEYCGNTDTLTRFGGLDTMNQSNWTGIGYNNIYHVKQSHPKQDLQQASNLKGSSLIRNARNAVHQSIKRTLNRWIRKTGLHLSIWRVNTSLGKWSDSCSCQSFSDLWDWFTTGLEAGKDLQIQFAYGFSLDHQTRQ